MNTKSLYQELILNTLINNGVRTMTFKGDDNFAKRFSHVTMQFNGNHHSMLVYHKGLSTPLGQFYFDFTVDYATMIEHIESDLYRHQHNMKTLYFDFEIYGNK